MYALFFLVLAVLFHACALLSVGTSAFTLLAICTSLSMAGCMFNLED